MRTFDEELQMQAGENGSWYAPLREVKSLGSQSARPGSLAGLHEARKEHHGQFFTPDALAAFVWSLVEPAMRRAYSEGRGQPISLFDNSIGSGRLVQFARPDFFSISGVDVHADSAGQLAAAAEAAGFSVDIKNLGMESIKPHGFDVGLINPPFSIHIEAPTLNPYPCTIWGKFGPNSSALSHAYALYQALDACTVVAAILPATYAREVAEEPSIRKRLAAIIDVPARCFKEEETNVAVSVLVFDHPAHVRTPREITVSSLDERIIDLDLSCLWRRGGRLNPVGIDEGEPTITLPVTGDATVKVGHSGRKIVLKFSCGLTQAKVLNSILGERVESTQPVGGPYHRYPKGVRYTGQGKLDVEVYLSQPDPVEAFSAFVSSIRAAGGVPQVDEGLVNYVARRARQVVRQKTPLRHTVFASGYVPSTGSVTGKARKAHLLNPAVWGSPIIKAGQVIEFTASGKNGGYSYEVAGKAYEITAEDLSCRFVVEQADKPAAGWTLIHEGRRAAFPQIAASWAARAKALKIDEWLSWGYQVDDLIELFVAPGGCITAWDMGLGKARLAAAAILLSGATYGLIVVEPHLVPEMVRELSALPIARDSWQVIRTASDLDSLKTINVISYNRLRARLDPKGGKTTYAKRLRRRIGLLVADEGHILKSLDSQQTRALWDISARRRFIFTGTPIANYPRDILPLLCFASGDGTAAQPYGFHRGYMEERFFLSMAYAVRGIDRFKDDFVTLEWVTNQFAEELQEGAKREIPKIKDLYKFRSMIAPHVKRRVMHEPEVAAHISIPKATDEVTTLEWDEKHLAHYLTVAEDFVGWYRKEREEATKSGRNVNLVALLARIQAVQIAVNHPQAPSKYFHPLAGLTSKQRYLVDRLVQLAEEGHKTILYARWPELLELLHCELEKRGIKAVVMHGKRDIKQRTRDLDDNFRFGDAPVLLASLGVTQTGLNIHQADRLLFAERSWVAKTEAQARARALRPQQKRKVVAEFVHLQGGIDEYQAQMVAFKADAANAGLDWGTPETDGVEFDHLDTIFGRFCENLSKLYGCERSELRWVVGV